MGWKDRREQNSRYVISRNFFAYLARAFSWKRLAFCCFAAVSVVLVITYTRTTAIVYRANIPRTLSEAGYDATSLVSTIVSALPSAVAELRDNAIDYRLGAPESDGSCYSYGWRNDDLLRELSETEFLRPHALEEFRQFEFIDSFFSVFGAIDVAATILGFEKLKLYPVIIEADSRNYIVRVDVRRGDNYIRGHERHVTNISLIEKEVLDAILRATHPAAIALASRSRDLAQYVWLVKYTQQFQAGAQVSLAAQFGRLNAIQYGSLIDANVDDKRIAIDYYSAALMEHMAASEIKNNDLELRLIYNQLHGFDGMNLFRQFSIADFETWDLVDAQPILQALINYKNKQDISFGQELKATIAIIYLQNSSYGAFLRHIENYIGSLEASDYEVAGIALDYALNAALAGYQDISSSLILRAENLSDLDRTPHEIMYVHDVARAAAEIINGGSDATERIIASDEFHLYPCTSLDFLSIVSISRNYHGLQINFSRVDQGMQILEATGLRSFEFYNLWGIILASMERYRDAIQMYGRARGYEGDTVWALLNEGNSYLRLRDYVQAEQRFRESLTQAMVPAAVFGLLDSHLNQEDYTNYFIVLDVYEKIFTENAIFGLEYAKKTAEFSCTLGVNIPNYITFMNAFDVTVDEESCTAIVESPAEQ